MSGSIVLSRFCSFGTGGKANIKRLTNTRELSLLADASVVLGKGTNVLISDDGVDGLVLINELCGYEFNGESVTAYSGISLPLLCKECKNRELSGLEWASGLPGSVGGAVKMNAGAFGGNIASVIESVTVYRSDKFITLTPNECGFTYRGSKIDGFIVSARFRLKREKASTITQKTLEFAKRRTLTQPKGKSAGSVFKGADKPAGWYIERAGLKGARVGGAVISEKHANFILNDDGASSSEIYELMTKAERKVYEIFGVKLEREIILIGEF